MQSLFCYLRFTNNNASVYLCDAEAWFALRVLRVCFSSSCHIVRSLNWLFYILLMLLRVTCSVLPLQSPAHANENINKLLKIYWNSAERKKRENFGYVVSIAHKTNVVNEIDLRRALFAWTKIFEVAWLGCRWNCSKGENKFHRHIYLSA